VGAAVVVAVAGAGVAVTAGDRPDRLSVAPAGTTSPVVTDGTRVATTGRVVQVPGRAVRFCAPVPTADVGWLPGHQPAPQHCDVGVDVEGVDLAALHDRRERDGAVEGWARLAGSYRDGTLTVEDQRPPEVQDAAAPAPSPDVPPCDPPTGGWPRDPALLRGPGSEGEGDVNLQAQQSALERHRAGHPDLYVMVALLRPHPDAVLLGVAAASPQARDAVERALRPAYGEQLCVVVSDVTREQVEAARTEFDLDAGEWSRLGIYGGSGEGLREGMQVEVGYEVVRVTEELQRRADRHPPGLLVLRPWLVPV
jgi:hypothetical protein